MSDEQPTSWRDRLFGSSSTAPRDRATDEHAVEQRPEHEGAVAPADDVAQSVDEHGEHQPLVEHDGEADTAVLDTRAAAGGRAAQEHSIGAHAEHADTERAAADRAESDRAEADRADSPIEPTVIAPSTLRGPSHSAAHPDDMARATADDVHGEAADSSLERGHADDEADARDGSGEPPELVEPRRPAFGLRRRSRDAEAGSDADTRTDARADDHGSDADAHAALAAGGSVAASGAAAASHSGGREFVEPEPTQAMDAQPNEQATQPLGTQREDLRRHDAQPDDAAQTRVLDAQPDDEQRTQRFGIIRDEVPASAIPVDDETARAAARGGTPIVLVEEPLPPRRKGARGVGFAVALLATLLFAILFAAAAFAVGYLFDRAFDPMETLQTLWLRPSYLLPIAMFLLAYLIVTLIVNRAGWWAHVLGGFVVALLVYAAHIAGAFMEQQGGWAGVAALPGIDAQSLGQLLLAPLSVLAFVIAREMPVWVGGIVARRGRKAREWNRQALDDFNAEHAERLAAYERARS